MYILFSYPLYSRKLSYRHDRMSKNFGISAANNICCFLEIRVLQSLMANLYRVMRFFTFTVILWGSMSRVPENCLATDVHRATMASATVLERTKSDILLGWFCFLKRRQKRRIAALSGNPCSSVSSPGSFKALSSGRSGGGVEEDGELEEEEEEDGGDSVPASGEAEEDGGDPVSEEDGDPVPTPVLVEEEEGDWYLVGEEDGDAIISTLERSDNLQRYQNFAVNIHYQNHKVTTSRSHKIPSNTWKSPNLFKDLHIDRAHVAKSSSFGTLPVWLG